jgi:transcriptional regulator with XRE-family HTH domain
VEINFARLGQMIAHARREQRLTGEQLARVVGIHPVTLSRIEHGKLPGVTVAVLTQIAWYLDLRLDQLVDNYPGKRLREVLARAEALEKAVPIAQRSQEPPMP